MQCWDVIGDIHGHAEALEQLLVKLGYVEAGDGGYVHPAGRRVLFLGDFIDGGTQNRRVVEIARAMVTAGRARAILGNHEYNAICWHTPDPHDPSRWLRAHSEKNLGQHQSTLEEFADDPQGLAQAIEWFRTLPLYIDLGTLRAVHACWHTSSLAYVRRRLGEPAVMTDAFLAESADETSPAHESVEILLKGLESELPAGVSFRDKYGTSRSRARLRWWLADASTLDELVIGNTEIYEATAGLPADSSLIYGYPQDAPPVFFGHYWLTGQPVLQQSNIACLDYSVARGGELVAYQWDGERLLSAEHFCH